jgi:Phosphodiester glycosidase
VLALAGRAQVAALLTILASGPQPPDPRLAVVTPEGTSALADLPRGAMAGTAAWRPGSGGIEWAELELRGQGEARRIKVVAVRLDPARFRLSLENGMAPGGFLHVWTLDRAPDQAALALNAGMFRGDGAWGWVVHAGVEYRVPRAGPLAVAVVVDSLGTVRLLDDAGLDALRSHAGLGGTREAFQSYPRLLEAGGKLPALLTAPGGEINLEHRDARLALGVDTAGRLLVALTRFDALGPSLGSVPFGLTIPETAWLMRGLGAETAVGLDGGISAQLLLRDAGGEMHRWPGLRMVPLGLSAVPVGVSGERGRRTAEHR